MNVNGMRGMPGNIHVNMGGFGGGIPGMPNVRDFLGMVVQ